MKLDPVDFATLHAGLDTLQTVARGQYPAKRLRDTIQQIKSARSALDAIGTY